MSMREAGGFSSDLINYVRYWLQTKFRKRSGEVGVLNYFFSA